MKKRLIVLCLITVYFLSGCRLAREAQGTESGHDRMIGVMVTEEHLDLFDFEAYINDHASSFVGSGTVEIENSPEYNRRMYANMENSDCVFEGLDGILFANYYFEEDHVSGYRNTPCTGIGDGTVNLDEADGAVKLSMDGTIFVSDKLKIVGFFYNPVYQDSEGRVYLTAGTGMSTNVMEGGNTSMAHTLSDKYEMTIGNQVQSYEADIEIGVQVIRLPEKYVIISMSEDHSEISRQAYTPEQIPQTILPEDGAEYLLVESHSVQTDGKQIITRSLYSHGENAWLDVFVPWKNGICIKSSARIQW